MGRGKYKKYTSKDVYKALADIRNGLSVRLAGKQNYVPFATLQAKYKGTSPLDARSGPKTIFSKEEEKKMSDWLIALSRQGFPMTREEFLDAVQSFVIKLDKPTPFVNNRPSAHWYFGFMKRNKELTEKTNRNLSQRRGDVNECNIRGWFISVDNYLKERKLTDIEPNRIFHLDESAFLLAVKGDKVIVHKRDKNAYTLCTDEKECYTGLICAHAAGDVAPTMIVYPYEIVPAKISMNFPNEFVIGKSPTGWMTSVTFYMYIKNTFYPWCVKKGFKFPIILYIDGHSSHMTLELSDFCVQNKIELIALYPNATHLMQPLDVGLFSPLKKNT